MQKVILLALLWRRASVTATILMLLLNSFTAIQAQTPLSDYWNTQQPNTWLKYHSINPVNKEIATVQLHGQSGLLHISGKELTPLVYTHCTPLKDPDFFKVSLYSLNGVIKTDGTVVVPPEYQTVTLDNDLFRACNSATCTEYTKSGLIITQKNLPQGIQPGVLQQDGFTDATINGSIRGLIDSSGNWAIEPQFTFLHPKEKGYWYGSIGKHTQLIHPGKKWVGKEVFYSIDWLTDNGFWARKGDYSGPLRFYNYEEQVQKQFPSAERVSFTEEHRILLNNEKYSLIDLKNNVILAGYDQITRYHYRIPPTVENPFPAHPLLYMAGDKGKQGFFDGREWRTPQLYNYLAVVPHYWLGFQPDSVAIFEPGGKLLRTLHLPGATFGQPNWLYSRSKTDSVYHLQKGWIKLPKGVKYVNDCRGYLQLTTTRFTYSLMAENGAMFLEDSEDPFSDGFSANPYLLYKKQGRYGWKMIDGSHTESPQYDKIHQLMLGALVVQQNLRWGLVNYLGKVLIPIEYDDMKWDMEARFVMLKKDGRWSAYFPSGLPILSGTFEDLEAEYNGAIWAKQNGKWQAFSLDGIALLPELVKAPLNRNYDHYITKSKGKYGKISPSGAVLEPFIYDTIFPNNQPERALKGDSIYVFEAKLMLPGNNAFTLYPFGYAVESKKKWQVYYKNGTLLSQKKYETAPWMSTGKPAFWARTAPKKWELTDIKGNVIETLTADSLRIYHEPYLAVIDGTNRYILSEETGEKWPLKYESISKTNNGLFISRNGSKSGVINQQFLDILPCRYDRIHDFDGDYFQVLEGNKTGLFDKTGKVCIPLDDYDGTYISQTGDDLFTIKKNSLVGIYAKSTQKWMPASMEDIRSCSVRLPLSKQLYWFRVNGLYGIMDEDCKDVLPPVYKGIQDGDYYFLLADNAGEHLYDPLKRRIIAGGFSEIRVRHNRAICQKGDIFTLYKDDVPQFTQKADHMTWFSENLLLFTDPITRKSGLLRLDGSVQLPAEYITIEDNYTQEAVFARKKEGLGLISLDGKIILPFEYSSYKQFGYKSGYWILYKNKLCGLYGRMGEEILPVQFSQISISNDETHFIATKEGLLYFYDRNSQLMHTTGWEAAFEFTYGLAPVKKEGKWGYINPKGETIIPFQYRYAGSFVESNSKRVALVIADKHYQLIDPDGQELKQEVINRYSVYGQPVGQLTDLPAYKEIPFYADDYTVHGYYAVSRQDNEKKGLVNLLGEWALRPEYDEFKFSESSGKIMAAARIGKLWGFIGYSGETLAVPQFEQVEFNWQTPNRYKVTKAGKVFEVDEKGQ